MDSSWWFDYLSGHIVRKADSKRWPVEDVTPLMKHGIVDIEAVERWVQSQPTED